MDKKFAKPPKKKSKMIALPAPTKKEDWDSRPRLTFMESQLPGVTDFTIGQKIKIEVECEVVELGKKEYGSEKEKGKPYVAVKVLKVGQEEANEKEENE